MSDDDGGIQFYQTHQQHEEQQMNQTNAIHTIINEAKSPGARQADISATARLYSLATMTGVGLKLELGENGGDAMRAYDRVIGEFMALVSYAFDFSEDEVGYIQTETEHLCNVQTEEFVAFVRASKAKKGGAA